MTTDNRILSSPKCERCGYVVPNLVPVGAACPECHARFGASSSSSPAPSDDPERIRLIGIIEAQEVHIRELERKLAELEAAAAAGGTP